MKRIGASLALVLSFVVVQPSEAAPPDFAVTDCPGVSDSVLRLYTAGLGRTADEAGYDFWFEQYQSGNWSLQRAAEHFVVAEEFAASYGSLNNLEFVEQLYRNVLGRAGERGGVEFWTGQLDSGDLTRATVLLNFAESPENVELSGTTSPSLGFFNGGLEGPWTCAPQPANGTCQVGTFVTGEPQWDITIEIPESISETAVVATFEVLRDGVVLQQLPMQFHSVASGQRLRGMASILSSPSDPLEGVPIEDLSCRVIGIDGEPDRRGLFDREIVEGQLDMAECQAEQVDAFVQVGDIFFRRFVRAEVSAVNTAGVGATGSGIVVFLVDGFRIGDFTAVFGAEPGAAANDSRSLHTDVIPVGIDPRRVTCEVRDLFWVAN